MESLGARIALYRNSRRWTQDKLASELGITQALLSDIENDKKSPRWEMINRIAERLEIPILNLLPFSAGFLHNQYSAYPENTTENNTGTGVADQERRLWEALLKAKDEMIASLKQQLESNQKFCR